MAVTPFTIAVFAAIIFFLLAAFGVPARVGWQWLPFGCVTVAWAVR